MAAKSKTNLAKINMYVKGRLNASDMHELERETYDDAFLNEAMDGFEDFAADDHEQTIANLKTQLRSRVSTEKGRRVVLWPKLAIAASVLLILGMGYWLLRPLNDGSENEKFTSKVKPLAPTVTKDADKIDSEEPAQLLKQKRKLIADNVKAKSSITYKTDTVEYIANAYPVRANAKIEDMLKKAEGFEVDTNGRVLFNGQPVTKARLNGKDYMGGDVNKAIQSLPADIVEKFQVVDDYGDQAGKTGIKAGEPNKVLNLTTTEGNTLNEVVVVGYGTQKKSALVGSVSNLPAVSAPLSGKIARELNKVLNLTTQNEIKKSAYSYQGYLSEPAMYMPQVIYKQDTVEYITNNYPIANEAKVLNVLNRLPGFERDGDGLLIEGRRVIKIKVNSIDDKEKTMLGIAQKLPADVLEKVQVIDDYSNLATIGMRTPEADKVINLVVRDMKNRRLPWAYDLNGVIVPGDTVERPKPAIGWKKYADYVKQKAGPVSKQSNELTLYFYVGTDGNLSSILITGHRSAAQYEKARAILKDGPAWLGYKEPRQIWMKIKLKND